VFCKYADTVARALQPSSAVMVRHSIKRQRNTPANVTQIERLIYLIRGHKVMLDQDLVTTKRFNEQIRRNKRRFPPDFMFKMTRNEYENLRSQFATSSNPLEVGTDEYQSLRSQFATLKTGRGKHRKYLPNLFTEHGAIMAASVLNSPKAVEMSIFVVRAFVRLRELLSTHHQLAAKLDELERRLSTHDEQIVVLFEAIKQLMEEPVPEKRRIGFGAEDG
jgi:hypothetical protein